MKPEKLFNSFEDVQKEAFWSKLDSVVIPIEGIVISQISLGDLQNLDARKAEVIFRDNAFDWQKIESHVGPKEARTLQGDLGNELDSMNYLVLLYCDGSYVTCISG